MTKTIVAVAASVVALGADGPVHSFGAPNAPITIELYSDFQCPACKALHESTIRELRRTYVNAGKVRIVYHDIHLPMHKYAKLAGSYAIAAERMGLYDSVADKLFETQQTWDQNGKVDEIVASVVPAPQMMKLRAAAADPSIAARIDKETNDALQEVRIGSTPTMIVHKGPSAERVGNVSMPILSRYLDMLLSK